MSWTVSETVFNLKSIGVASIHLKMDNNCMHPYNQVYCKDIVSFQTVLISSHF
jgi:hypothetical protein